MCAGREILRCNGKIYRNHKHWYFNRQLIIQEKEIDNLTQQTRVNL